jgi:glycosyltransferase involved in cell wall biosynthesis
MVFAIEALKTWVYEYRMYKAARFDLFTFVSSSELEYVTKRFPNVSTFLSPIGVNDNFSGHEVPRFPTDNIMVFVGNLSYFSNIESISWFVDSVYPLILNDRPDARLRIVGKQPSTEILKLAVRFPGIEVMGDVDDTLSYLQSATVVIAPMVSGAGVKVKIADALSARKLVISTRLGIEGTDYQSNEHLLVVENLDSQGYASACLDVLNDPDKYHTIADQGYKHVIGEYSWDNLVAQFETELMSAMQRKKANNPTKYVL